VIEAWKQGQRLTLGGCKAPSRGEGRALTGVPPVKICPLRCPIRSESGKNLRICEGILTTIETLARFRHIPAKPG
jgi:hypothetical protein